MLQLHSSWKDLPGALRPSRPFPKWNWLELINAVALVAAGMKRTLRLLSLLRIRDPTEIENLRLPPHLGAMAEPTAGARLEKTP